MRENEKRSARRAGPARCALWVGVLCAAGGVAGCAPGADVAPGVAAGAPAPATARAEAAGGRAGPELEGTFSMPWGVARLRYRMVDGRRVYQGDMTLPPPLPEGVAAASAARSVGVIDASRLWEGHVVPVLRGTLSAAQNADVDAAIAVWESTTSIRFVPFDVATHPAALIISASGSGCHSDVGRPADVPGPDFAIAEISGCSAGSVIHELGHAIGLQHEQSRGDRDDHVVVDTNCVDGFPDDQRPNFAFAADAVDLGLYDHSSLMHYGSTFFYDDGVDDNGLPAVPPWFALCTSTTNTLWRRSGPAGSQLQVVAQRIAPSFIDREGVEEMYGDGMGHAVAVGDFNGDGLRDVAVGSPRAGSFDEGRVSVFRGSAAGLVLDTTVLQTAAPLPGDRFGYALTTGDFNNDGLADLAIGAPGMAGSGRVVVMRGRALAAGVVAPLATLNQSTLSAEEGGDRFGYALTAGDFTGDGVADLAVGAPGEGWVGAPGSGAAFVFRGGAALTPVQMVGQGALDTDEAGDNFGASLARGDFDADGVTDLAVGAPHERPTGRPEAGAAYVFRGGATLTGIRRLVAKSGGTFEEDDMFFGFAMSAGDFNNDGYADVAVGAPGATVAGARWAGRVFVYEGAASGPPASAARTLTATSPVQGAAFGFSLDAGMFDPDAVRDLAVGAPGDTPSPNVGSGRVYAFRGAAAGLSLDGVISQSGPGIGNVAGDRFGSAVAFGNIDGANRMELVVGADGERWALASTGRAYVLRYSGGAFSHWTNHGP